MSRSPSRSGVDETIIFELDDARAETGEPTSQAKKKNFAEALSRRLAQRFADGLRVHFGGILPDAQGKQQESVARTAKGVKKLDVNYSTIELGLGLGVSIKTLNFRDARSKRYTKNYTRIDNELRAEASDYHERQPYATLVAAIFLPADSCDDGGRNSASSFGQAVRLFRSRSGRQKPVESPVLFEAVFIGIYDADGDRRGRVKFFDVTDAPPRRGRPSDASLIGFSDLIARIKSIYGYRNNPAFTWAPDNEVPPTA